MNTETEVLNCPADSGEADEVQEEVARRVLIRPLSAPPRTVAALDAAYGDDSVCAAASLFAVEPLRLIETRVIIDKCPFPYLPGYLFRREAPALQAALAALPARPDLLLVEGHGIAHPRRCGIASHLGVLNGIPSVGCAKKRLVGTSQEPGWQKGSWSPLYDGEMVGAVVRTRSGVKPLFVSVGHLVTLQDAIELVLRCCGEYRLPEPLRSADSASRRGLMEMLHLEELGR